MTTINGTTFKDETNNAKKSLQDEYHHLNFRQKLLDCLPKLIGLTDLKFNGYMSAMKTDVAILIMKHFFNSEKNRQMPKGKYTHSSVQAN